MLIVGGSGAADTHAAGYEAGVMAYERGAYPEALKEFRALAAHGKAPAEFMLGAMYFYGKGVKSSDALAAIWFQRAAAKGDSNAQLAFGSLHINGLGVRQDLVKAYMWLSVASDSEAQGVRRQAILLRDEAAALMTADEIEEARRRADAWAPTRAGFSLMEKSSESE